MLVAMATQVYLSRTGPVPIPLCVGTLHPCPDLRVSLDWASTCPGGARSSLELAGGLWNPPKFLLAL